MYPLFNVPEDSENELDLSNLHYQTSYGYKAEDKKRRLCCGIKKTAHWSFILTFFFANLVAVI